MLAEQLVLVNSSITMTSLALSSQLLSSTRHGLLLTEQFVSSIREVLVTTQVCVPLLHPLGYCAMMVIDVVLRHHVWVGLLVASLLQRLAWCFLVSITGRRQLREFQFQDSLCPVSDMHSVFSNSELPSTSRDNQGKQQQAICFGRLWIALANNSKDGFSCLVLGIFLRWSLALGMSTVSPDERSSLELYIYIQNYVCCGLVFRFGVFFLDTSCGFFQTSSLLFFNLFPPSSAFTSFFHFLRQPPFCFPYMITRSTVYFEHIHYLLPTLPRTSPTFFPLNFSLCVYLPLSLPLYLCLSVSLSLFLSSPGVGGPSVYMLLVDNG